MYKTNYFMDSRITGYHWAPSSFDMNVIEDCWGALFAEKFVGSRQFETVEELKEFLIFE